MVQHITGKRFDCWDDLSASGGLDDEGSTYVALHFALSEALDDASSAVSSMTPAQVRAMMSLMFLGMIVELLAPEPVTKVLFMISMTSLIAFVGVDFFNHVVKGFTGMLDELGRARDFEGVRAAGIHYGQRIGPTVARIAVMVATYGIAKFAGLFKGSVLDLPGGSRAAALAEAQGFSLTAAEQARSVTLTANGTVVIDLGTASAMAAAGGPATAPNRSAILERLASLRPGRSKDVFEVDTKEQMERLFDELARGGTPANNSTYPGKMVELPDGARVGLRPDSASGGMTIDIRLSDGAIYKVHLP